MERRRHVLSIVALGAFFALAVASTQETAERDVSSQQSSFTVTARELYADYEANEIAADERYKGTVFTVTGDINNIGKDIADTMYVTLKTDKFIGSVQCFFSGAHKGALAGAAKGVHVSLKCKGGGKFGNVLMRGCEFTG